MTGTPSTRPEVACAALGAAAPSAQLHVTEAQHQQSVIDVARPLGWLTYHTHDSRRSTPGFPDLVLVRAPRIVYAELKTDKGRVQPAQIVWLRALRAAGAEVFVWRPRDWDTIVETLTSRHRCEVPEL